MSENFFAIICVHGLATPTCGQAWQLKVYVNLSFGPPNRLFLFTCRFHYIGLFVLFIHDFADVFLELAKSILYFKDRDGKSHNLPEILANVLFAIFVLQW